MPTADLEGERSAPVNYAVEYRSGKRELHGLEPPAFTISVADRPQLERVLKGDVYSAALSFIHREFDIAGDLVAAIHLRQAISQPVAFQDADWTLDQAQDAKLQQICEDLKLRAGDRFLDVGCGWGALVVYAADCYKARATGCTLSQKQCQFVRSVIRVRGMENLASIQEMDYRDLSRRLDKIASIGMFEHCWPSPLGRRLPKNYSLLESDGRFLNSGIVRPQNVADGAETWFLQKRVFPGGELVHLSDVVGAAEKAGLEILRKADALTTHEPSANGWSGCARTRTSASGLSAKKRTGHGCSTWRHRRRISTLAPPTCFPY